MKSNRQNHWRASRCSAIALLALIAQIVFVDQFAVAQILSPPPMPLNATDSVPVRKLMTAHWDGNETDHAQVRKTFQAASQNEDLLVAFMINCVHNHQTKDAKLAALELTNRFSDNMDGWIFKTWLNTLTDEYDSALISMRTFKKKIDANKALTDDSRKVIYTRLGRLIGYMQGPVSDKVNQDLLNGTIQIVTRGATPDSVKIFNENRDKILKQYDDLVKAQGQKTQVELAKVKVANDAEAVGLEREVQLLEQTESQLRPEKQRIRDEGARQIASIEQQGSSLQSQLTQIGGDIRATEFDLQLLYSNLNLLLQQPPRFQVGVLQLQNQIRNAELALVSLGTSANQTSQQINSLSAQLVQVRNGVCLLYTSPSPRDRTRSRMPSSA